jgi:hypothetical protein
MTVVKLYDLARMTTQTVGTGTITLGVAVPPYLAFSAAGVQDGDTVRYAIYDPIAGGSEIGYGTYTASGTTLTRNPHSSTNANAAINLSGQAQVFITASAFDFVPAVYRPEDFAPAGTTDWTTAFQAMATAIAANSGNAVIEFVPGFSYNVYNSGQSISSPLLNFNSCSNIRIFGTGATLVVGHTFSTSDNLTLINLIGSTNVWVDGVNVTQTNGVTVGSSTPYGTLLIAAADGCAVISLTNSVITGCQGPIECATTVGVVVENVQCVNSLYGVVFSDGAGNPTSGPCSGIFVRGLSTLNADRSVFLHGVVNADISVVSQNCRANDVLITADQNSGVNENIILNYKALARTAGSNSASHITMGLSSAWNTSTNTILRNIRINLDVDESGDSGTVPTVQFAKSTTSELGTLFENIVITGIISGVANSAGHLIDLFTVDDQPWSGETAIGISIENFLVTGSTTPAFYVDYAPLVTSPSGALSLRNLIFPGNYTDANNSNVATQRCAINVAFGNLTPVLNPTFGGSGLFQPTAHSIFQAEGSAAFGLITAATAGNIIVDQGSGSDWLSKTISGNATLSASGVLTVTGASGQFTSTAARTIASGASATLDDINIAPETTTVTGTTNITTAKGFNKTSLYQPTITDSSSVTISNASTLYIDNAPLAGGSVTITNPWALNVGAGQVFFQGANAAGTITDGDSISDNALVNIQRIVTSLGVTPFIEGQVIDLQYNNSIAAGSAYGLFDVVTAPSGNSTNHATIQAAEFIAKNSSTGTVTNLIGAAYFAQNAGSGTVTNLYGVNDTAANIGGGNVGSMYGSRISVQHTHGGTVTSAWGIVIAQPTGAVTGDTSTWTNLIGIELQNQNPSGAGTNTLTNPPIALLIDSQTASGAYAIQQNGSGIVSFASPVTTPFNNLTVYTVTTLPSTGRVTGSVALVSDATSNILIGAGGGSAYALVTWNGSAWVAV